MRHTHCTKKDALFVNFADYLEKLVAKCVFGSLIIQRCL